jgi:GMP synthase (glutamine-hydrolysing)
MVQKPVLLVTHVTEGDPGQIPILLEKMGQPVRVMRANKGEPFPDRVEDYAGVASFGGPQSANDDHVDYLRAELGWLPRVMAAGVPLLGVCLGGQMVARVLGGTVAPHPEGHYEFGYYPIDPVDDAAERLALANSLHVALRHGEAFTIPDGAQRLARRPLFENQAYRYGSTTWGIQFHPEVNDKVLDRWLNREPRPEDLDRDGAQTIEQQRANHTRYHEAMHAWLGRFLALWLGSGTNDV